MTITLNGDSGITTPMYNGTVSANQVTPSVNMKNRIINGAMVIDQRNNGASVTPTASAYTLDRWYANISQSSKFSVQQNAGSVTTPAGFTNYLGITSLSAYSISSSDAFVVYQRIEGNNMADLGWGTSNAKPVTISFWAKCSVANSTFSIGLRDGSFSYSYVVPFTITTANTWQYVTMLITPPSVGTYSSTNSYSLDLHFCLCALGYAWVM